MDIGDSIRKLRMWREMTQKELAQRIGVSANALCAIELNRSFPSKEKWLQAIEKIRSGGAGLTQRDYLGDATSGRGILPQNRMGGGIPTNPIQWEAKYWIGTATPEEVRRMAKGQ